MKDDRDEFSRQVAISIDMIHCAFMYIVSIAAMCRALAVFVSHPLHLSVIVGAFFYLFWILMLNPSYHVLLMWCCVHCLLFFQTLFSNWIDWAQCLCPFYQCFRLMLPQNHANPLVFHMFESSVCQ